MNFEYICEKISDIVNNEMIPNSLSDYILKNELDNIFINSKEIIEKFYFLLKFYETLNINNDPNLYLKCRNVEENKISNFINRLLSGDKMKKTTLILYGQPGIGKTHLIYKLKEELENLNFDFIKLNNENKNNEIENLKIIYLNSMNFDSTKIFLNTLISWIFKKDDIYSELIIDHMNEWDLKFEKIKIELDKKLIDNKYLILIDELDYLKNQDNVNFSNIIDFFNYNRSGLIKIGVSNTFDLFGSYKNKSKNGLNFLSLNFKPYNEENLKNILLKKFNSILKIENEEEFIKKLNQLIDPKVFIFITKKIIKKGSSDFRKVLSLIKEVLFKYLKNELNKIIEITNDEKINLKIKINLDFAHPTINNFLKDKRPEIFLNFNLYTKYYLLSIFLNYDNENFILDIKKINNTFKELLKNDITEKNFDFESILKNLTVYNFLEEKNMDKIGYEIKIGYIDLKCILEKYEHFKIFFNN